MDILSGLTAATKALEVLKGIRELDESIGQAEFKLKLADLTSLLADTKVALADAKTDLNAKAAEIANLSAEIERLKKGDFCPRCHSGRLQLISTEEYPYQGLHIYGVEEWHYGCDNPECGFEQNRLHDPHNVIPGTSKR
ncbi:hypothetical protein [Rhodovulum marinum]|uniref:hypothetical protein n=1 Tax=Rhodovulum marinum TaxID=320662 RepID=UPI0010461CBC|nr:hypothetical protein [Rhodovulum marinum]